MKKIFLVLGLFLSVAAAQAQYARRIVPAAGLPAFCQPGNGEVVFLTAGQIGMYQCEAVNTWRPVGLTSLAQQLNIAQGILTVSAPFVNHTATWNAGAVTFTNIFSNITDTASAAASLLADLQVGGASRFSITKGGSVISGNGSFVLGALGRIFAGGDGYFVLLNNATDGFTALNLGPSAVTHPRIAVSAPVAGQTQGIIIYKGDGSTAVFANLGAATNGSMIYCGDCTIASPCAAGGTGSIAKRLNGVWVCN